MKILRVSVNNQKLSFEPLPSEWLHLGGSALIAKMLNKEVPPECDPLGPENKLIVSCGRTAEVKDILNMSSIDVEILAQVEPDPTLEIIEKAGLL